ncbi:hypothetical protein PUW25_25325 (plasmid) [Paenibacillus urinalis]|uniref:Carboxypeptidase regulatory-like domain-containing protein n=1 Tax=Paenibacillus urinalis TaxID=521520 RepID=A0ABY7XH73_9BACL|nr:hypothetical protein [Paenibacillus urinalis]WDI05132.1 hypothetical protein PUW25_25325 [Paenibacillus urinalis]
MKHIGEYAKNQEIILELLTYDEESMPIPADFFPTAIVEYYSSNGLTQVAHVTLEEAKNGLYMKSFTVPESFNTGHYVITYEATIDGELYTVLERFRVIGSSNDSSSTPTQKVAVSDLTILTPSGLPTTVVMAGGPVKLAVVRIWSQDKKTLIDTISTDAQGHWHTSLYPGSYQFEFIHPNGTLLRTLEKVVK